MDESNQPVAGGQKTAEEPLPGDTISPVSGDSSPSPVAEPIVPAAIDQSTVTNSTLPVTESLYTSESSESKDQPASDTEDAASITWTASEFIAHTKSAGWYFALGLTALVAAAIIFYLTRDKITTAVVIVAAIALGTYAGRKPRELQYELHGTGLSIAGKYFPYENFRSFAVIDEGALSSIAFIPMKRFGQLLTVYFNPQDETAIVDLLASRLPLEERQHDMLDRFMKRIRF